MLNLLQINFKTSDSYLGGSQNSARGYILVNNWMKFDHMSQNFKSIKLKEERLPKTKKIPKHHTNVPLRYNKASLVKVSICNCLNFTFA